MSELVTIFMILIGIFALAFIIVPLFVFLFMAIVSEINTKCPYWKHCRIYTKDDIYCDKTGGDYDTSPFDFHGVGCYRQFAEHGNKCEYWIDRKEKAHVKN